MYLFAYQIFKSNGDIDEILFKILIINLYDLEKGSQRIHFIIQGKNNHKILQYYIGILYNILLYTIHEDHIKFYFSIFCS